MGWTKRQLITAAYEEIGLADYVFDLSPEQFQAACRKMDAMIAEWEPKIKIAYHSADTPETTSIDSDSGIPSFANTAVYLNLAIRLGTMIGKNISPDTRASARMAYLDMLNAAMPVTLEYQMPQYLPRGAGQKPWRMENGPFMPQPVDRVTTGGDGEIELDN